MADLPRPDLDIQQLLHAAADEEATETHSRTHSHFRALRLSLPPPLLGATPYEAWRRLRLEVVVTWPLQLLVHPAQLAKYSDLFSFLLVVKRVQTELHAYLARPSTPPPPRPPCTSRRAPKREGYTAFGG